MAVAIDSRQYRFGFLIASLDDYPADFDAVSLGENFRIALFLPRDDAGWFGRSRYPPRVVMVSGDAIEVRPHPASREHPIGFRLSELQFIECGHILLQGWLRFVAVRYDVTLAYNTGSSSCIDEFLAELRAAVTPPPAAETAAEPTRFGEPLDLKFTNALRYELAPGECARIQLFNPAKLKAWRWGVVRRETWSAGDLLVLTSRRLLWIADRSLGRHQRYGTVTSYAPIRSLQSWRCGRAGETSELVFRFVRGSEWRVPVPASLEGAAAGFLNEFEQRWGMAL
jgi:hypothetical protein